MELIKHSELKTIEDYKAYRKQQNKLWYMKNRERKIQYQRDRYYTLKNNSNK